MKSETFTNRVKKFFGFRNNIVIDNDDVAVFNLILTTIDKTLLAKIINNQDLAYYYDSRGATVECCICLNENVEFATIKCRHCICVTCYSMLMKTEWINCPYCRQKMELVPTSKMHAVMVQVEDVGLGIIYLPPIYDDVSSIWKSYDMVPFNNISRMTTIFKRINQHKYALVTTSDKMLHWIRTLKIGEVKKLNVVSYRSI